MAKTGKILKGFSPDALQKMMLYDWPGNVRELKNEVERAVVMTSKNIITEEMVLQTHEFDGEKLKPLKQAKSDFEKNYLSHLMILTEGNISKAAELSGKYRADLYNLLKKYNLKPEDFRKPTKF